MPVASPGVSTSFVLGTAAPTAVGGLNPGRRYILITNNDKTNGVTWAHGTNNGCTVNHHLIPPGSWYEFGPFEPGWGLLSDISMIAASGTPTISYLEL